MKYSSDVFDNESQTPTMLDLLRQLANTHLKDPKRASILERSIKSLLDVDWDKMKKRDVESFMLSNDVDLVLQVASYIGRNANYRASQRERLRLEGTRRFRAMIEQAGGAESMKDVEARLGVSDDTIRKRTKKGQIIAIPVGNRLEYPVWQFDGPQMVANFEQVLRILDTEHYVEQTRFFITSSKELDNLTPIEALKKGEQYLDRVKLKAHQFQQQGAK